MALVCYVQQLRADRQAVAASNNAAAKHRAHAELSSHRLLVDLTFVFEARSAGDYFQALKLSEFVDDALRNCLPEILDVWIGVGRERQDCE